MDYLVLGLVLRVMYYKEFPSPECVFFFKYRDIRCAHSKTQNMQFSLPTAASYEPSVRFMP